MSSFYCASAAMLGAGTDICTVKLSVASAAGVTVKLSSNNAAVSIPTTVTVPANTTALQFPAAISSVQTLQQVTLTAAMSGVTGTFALRLNPAVRTLTISAASIGFAMVQENAAVTQSLTLTSTGTLPLTINAATVSGTGFSMAGMAFPLLLNPGQTSTLSVQFKPTAAGAASGQLNLTSDSSSGSSVINLTGMGGVPILSAFYCASAAMVGAGTDICTIKLNAPSAAASGVLVNLSSNNAAVSLPATVTIPANTTAFQFPATVLSVKTVQPVTLTAATGGTTGSFALHLNAATGTLAASMSNLSFLNVPLNGTGTQTVTLASTGTGPVHISGASLTGTGFTLSGVTFPLVLTPGQTATLNVLYRPTATGTATGQLTLASDSTSGDLVVGLSGKSSGASLSSFYCSSASVLGTGTDICTVKLTMASPSSGTNVTFGSSNAAVRMPAATTVAGNATMAQITANIGTVADAQMVMLTATAGGVSDTFALQLTPATRTLSVSTGSMTFGTLSLDNVATQTLTLTSTGTLPVTINSASLNGSGFSIPEGTFPMTLTPNQKAMVSIQFDPIKAGTATGQLTLNSNASSGLAPVTLSGMGTPVTLSAFYCSQGSLMGAGTDICTVKLNVASRGTSVDLSTNNAAVTIPATVTTTSTSFQFTAKVSSVPTTQTVTLTATAGGATINFPLVLNGAIRTLSLSRSSVAFYAVLMETTATQSISLTSTGTLPVTVSGAASMNQAFTLSGATFPLTLNPGQSESLAVQFRPSSTGATTGVLTLTSDSSTGLLTVPLNGTSTRGANMAAVPEGYFPYTGSNLINSMEAAKPTTAISNDLFGMTVYNLAPNSLHAQPGMTPFPSLPVSTFRFWDVAYWAMMEPLQGQYNWTKMDNTVAIAQQNGVSDFIYTFGHVPAWASTNPADPCTNGEGAGSCTAPNMAAFDDFATQVVQRYCGKVKYYEPWNEPDGPAFWDGTNQQMLTISQHVEKIVKDPANCGCTNGSCSPNGGLNPNKVLLAPISNLSPAEVGWLDTYLTAAGPTYPYADIASFHGYVWSGYQPEEIASGVHLLQQTLAKHGMSNLELWNTEVSWQYNTNLPEAQQASWLMRYHGLQAALGVSRVLWYAYDQCTWGTLWASPLCPASQDTVGNLTQPGIAYGTTADWMVGANLTHCQQYKDGLWACELQHAGGYSAWMLWSSTGTSLSVPIPPSLQLTTYRDWQDEVNPLPAQLTITSSPVLLEQ